MNKQELIDKAVDELNGKLPEGRKNEESLSQSEFPYYFKSEHGIFRATGICENNYICELSEFTLRARKLGWINGYKYGVKYETNSNKPDLPDDVLVEVYGDGEWFENTRRCDMWFWETLDKFRIVDERYKPAEVEQVQADWYDYDKQQAIALPPVGVECEVYSEQKWMRCFVLHHANNDIFDVAACKIPQHEGCRVGFLVWADKFRPLDWNRKADEEKRKFVGKVIKKRQQGLSSADIKLLEFAYDVFTENKAAS